MALRDRITRARVHTGDRRVDELQAQAQRAAEALRLCPFVSGRMKTVSFVAGVPRTVNHGIGEPAAFMPIRVQGAPFQHGESLEQGIVQRAKSIGTWTNLATAAPGQTNGCRWRLKRHRHIVGIRFIWRSDFAAHTMTAKLWDDASGVVLASADVVVNGTGVYEARFASPVVADLVGKNITASVWNSLDMSYTNDTTWKALVGLEVGEDLTLLDHGIFANGDARPTNAAGAGIAYVVEPILAAGPVFAESDQTNVDPNTQLVVECSATVTADLWFYPRASRTVDSTTGESS